MSILKNIFTTNNNSEKTTEKKSAENFFDFTNIDQIEEIKSLSENEPILIFKHSTRCGISSMVLRQFKSKITREPIQPKVYLLDLLAYRNISNAIANEFQIIHQSPQIIVIKNGNAVYNSSHYEILETEFSRFQ